MRIAVIGGTGKEGRGISLRWARAGHEVRLGSRDAARGEATAAELKGESALALSGGSNSWALDDAEVALLAVPYGAHASTLGELKEKLQGKVLVDITVPLKPPAVRTVNLPDGGSAALEAQALLGDGVKVVATLHHVSATHLAEPEHTIDCDVLACSDDQQALDTVLKLLEDLGVRGFDAGKLRNSIALESITPVLLHLNRRYKRPGVGIRLSGL